MSGRVDPFARMNEPLPSFATKSKTDKPVATDVIDRIAEENNFTSRQEVKTSSPPRRKRRIHRTGRNQQFNAKATAETIERFYKRANETNLPLGELLRRGLEALEVVDDLQKLADRRNIPIDELLKQVLAAPDKEGVSR